MATTGRPSAEHAQMRLVLQNLDALDSTDPACDPLLGQLYALSKGPHGLELASSLGRADMAVIGRFAFDARPASRRPALRILNNALVLAPPATRLFVDAGLPEKAIGLVQSPDPDEEFLAARLLLLCSAHAAADLLPYLEQGGLAAAVNANIARHAEAPSPEPTLSCTANLQLLSVLAAKHEAQAHRFFASLGPMLHMFDRAPIRSPPLEPPLSLLLDSLAVLPFHSEPLTAPGEPRPPFNEDKLVAVLDQAVRAYGRGDLEPRITPLVSLLFYIARRAPTPESRTRLRALLLPSDDDRAQPLGRGDSLPHRLVRISTEAVTPELKKVLAHLLLALSDGDADQLVRNVGFGCGVGLLRSLGLPVPAGELGGETNSVTGQRRDAEAHESLPEMTGEEREREAERLFVLFERLRATGVNVENPVETAVRTGQMEEVGEDSGREQQGGQ